MANAWPLLIEVDCPEPRPQKGRLIVAADGTTWDMAKSSNVWLDPATLTLMLAPLPVTAAWRTTYTGNYTRYRKVDYTLTTAGKWKDLQIRAAGDYFLQSLDVTERATLTTAWSATIDSMGRMVDRSRSRKRRPAIKYKTVTKSVKHKAVTERKTTNKANKKRNRKK